MRYKIRPTSSLFLLIIFLTVKCGGQEEIGPTLNVNRNVNVYTNGYPDINPVELILRVNLGIVLVTRLIILSQILRFPIKLLVTPIFRLLKFIFFPLQFWRDLLVHIFPPNVLKRNIKRFLPLLLNILAVNQQTILLEFQQIVQTFQAIKSIIKTPQILFEILTSQIQNIKEILKRYSPLIVAIRESLLYKLVRHQVDFVYETFIRIVSFVRDVIAKIFPVFDGPIERLRRLIDKLKALLRPFQQMTPSLKKLFDHHFDLPKIDFLRKIVNVFLNSTQKLLRWIPNGLKPILINHLILYVSASALIRLTITVLHLKETNFLGKILRNMLMFPGSPLNMFLRLVTPFKLFAKFLLKIRIPIALFILVKILVSVQLATIIPLLNPLGLLLLIPLIVPLLSMLPLLILGMLRRLFFTIFLLPVLLIRLVVFVVFLKMFTSGFIFTLLAFVLNKLTVIKQIFQPHHTILKILISILIPIFISTKLLFFIPKLLWPIAVPLVANSSILLTILNLVISLLKNVQLAPLNFVKNKLQVIAQFFNLNQINIMIFLRLAINVTIFLFLLNLFPLFLQPLIFLPLANTIFAINALKTVGKITLLVKVFLANKLRLLVQLFMTQHNKLFAILPFIASAIVFQILLQFYPLFLWPVVLFPLVNAIMPLAALKSFIDFLKNFTVSPSEFIKDILAVVKQQIKSQFDNIASFRSVLWPLLIPLLLKFVPFVLRPFAVLPITIRVLFLATINFLTNMKQYPINFIKDKLVLLHQILKSSRESPILLYVTSSVVALKNLLKFVPKLLRPFVIIPLATLEIFVNLLKTIKISPKDFVIGKLLQLKQFIESHQSTLSTFLPLLSAGLIFQILLHLFPLLLRPIVFFPLANLVFFLSQFKVFINILEKIKISPIDFMQDRIILIKQFFNGLKSSLKTKLWYVISVVIFNLILLLTPSFLRPIVFVPLAQIIFLLPNLRAILNGFMLSPLDVLKDKLNLLKQLFDSHHQKLPTLLSWLVATVLLPVLLHLFPILFRPFVFLPLVQVVYLIPTLKLVVNLLENIKISPVQYVVDKLIVLNQLLAPLHILFSGTISFVLSIRLLVKVLRLIPRLFRPVVFLPLVLTIFLVPSLQFVVNLLSLIRLPVMDILKDRLNLFKQSINSNKNHIIALWPLVFPLLLSLFPLLLQPIVFLPLALLLFSTSFGLNFVNFQKTVLPIVLSFLVSNVLLPILLNLLPIILQPIFFLPLAGLVYLIPNVVVLKTILNNIDLSPVDYLKDRILLFMEFVESRSKKLPALAPYLWSLLVFPIILNLIPLLIRPFAALPLATVLFLRSSVFFVLNLLWNILTLPFDLLKNKLHIANNSRPHLLFELIIKLFPRPIRPLIFLPLAVLVYLPNILSFPIKLLGKIMPLLTPVNFIRNTLVFIKQFVDSLVLNLRPLLLPVLVLPAIIKLFPKLLRPLVFPLLAQLLLVISQIVTILDNMRLSLSDYLKDKLMVLIQLSTSIGEMPLVLPVLIPFIVLPILLQLFPLVLWPIILVPLVQLLFSLASLKEVHNILSNIKLSPVDLFLDKLILLKQFLNNHHIQLPWFISSTFPYIYLEKLLKLFPKYLQPIVFVLLTPLASLKSLINGLKQIKLTPFDYLKDKFQAIKQSLDSNNNNWLSLLTLILPAFIFPILLALIPLPLQPFAVLPLAILLNFQTLLKLLLENFKLPMKYVLLDALVVLKQIFDTNHKLFSSLFPLLLPSLLFSILIHLVPILFRPFVLIPLAQLVFLLPLLEVVRNSLKNITVSPLNLISDSFYLLQTILDDYFSKFRWMNSVLLPAKILPKFLGLFPKILRPLIVLILRPILVFLGLFNAFMSMLSNIKLPLDDLIKDKLLFLQQLLGEHHPILSVITEYLRPLIILPQLLLFVPKLLWPLVAPLLITASFLLANIKAFWNVLENLRLSPLDYIKDTYGFLEQSFESYLPDGPPLVLTLFFVVPLFPLPLQPIVLLALQFAFPFVKFALNGLKNLRFSPFYLLKDTISFLLQLFVANHQKLLITIILSIFLQIMLGPFGLVLLSQLPVVLTVFSVMAMLKFWFTINLITVRFLTAPLKSLKKLVQCLQQPDNCIQSIVTLTVIKPLRSTVLDLLIPLRFLIWLLRHGPCKVQQQIRSII